MRSNYVEVLKTQKRELERLMAQPDLIERAQLGWFEVNSTLAYFAVGVRRCGKSVLCRMALAKSGFPFGYIDFDDEPLHDVQPEDLNDLLEAVYAVYGPVKHPHDETGPGLLQHVGREDPKPGIVRVA